MFSSTARCGSDNLFTPPRCLLSWVRELQKAVCWLQGITVYPFTSAPEIIFIRRNFSIHP